MSSPSPGPAKSRTRSRGGRRRSRRNRSQVPPVPQTQTKSELDDSADDDYRTSQPQSGQEIRTIQPQQPSTGPVAGLPVVGDVLPVGNVGQTANGLVNGAQGTLSNVAGGALSGGGSKSDTLKLRLDLNLEVEVTLKARIHGDLTLALLDGA